MAGLVLKLSPHEAVSVNGVIIENGARKTMLKIKTANAHILRMRDAIRPEDAKTPHQKAYYIAQLAVAGGLPQREAVTILGEALADLRATTKLEDRKHLEHAILAVAQENIYATMRFLKEIISRPEQN